MKKKIPDIICGLLILLFAYTAFNKLLDIHRFETVLSMAPLIGKYSPLFAILIPSLELTIVLLVLLPRTQRIGLISAFTLLILFTAYLIYMVLSYPNLPCSCGGVIQQLSWKQHIVFNIFFILLGMVGIYFHHNLPINKHDQAFYEQQ